MNKEEIIQRLKELDESIAKLQKEKMELNPFANLKSMANKAFGEWSEEYVVSKVKNIVIRHGVGKDLYSEKLGRIEVKSTRSVKGITFNQIKPDYSDYHLFVIYDIDNIDTILYLVPNKLFNSELSISKQHNYDGDGNCYTMRDTKNNLHILEQYKISWEELDAKA